MTKLCSKKTVKGKKTQRNVSYFTDQDNLKLNQQAAEKLIQK